MKLTITKQTAEEIEIPIPSFWRLPSGQITALLDENTIVSAKRGTAYTVIENGTPDICLADIRTAYETGQPISEVEFFQTYDEILESISLTPKLKS